MIPWSAIGALRCQNHCMNKRRRRRGLRKERPQKMSENWCWPCGWENKILITHASLKCLSCLTLLAVPSPSPPCVPNSRWCGILLQGLGEESLFFPGVFWKTCKQSTFKSIAENCKWWLKPSFNTSNVQKESEYCWIVVFIGDAAIVLFLKGKMMAHLSHFLVTGLSVY